MNFQLSKDTSNLIKIVAAIMVMLHHYSQYVIANQFSGSIIYKALSAQAGFLGVAIFFFLSGYGLMQSEQKAHLNLWEFFKRRVLKIYLPVLSVTIIWLSASTLYLSQNSFENNISKLKAGATASIYWWGGGGNCLIYSALTNFGDPVLWFIKVLLLLYVTFYIFTVCWNIGRYWGMGCLMISAIGSSTFIALHYNSFEAISIPFFYIGVTLSMIRNNIKSLLSTCVLICIIGLCQYLTYGQSLAVNILVNSICLIVLIVSLHIIRIEPHIPTFIGAMSFDLYLVHNKVLMVMKGQTEHVHLLSYILVTISLTIIFYFFRTKILRLR